MNEITEAYKYLSAMHIKITVAFECYENKQGSSKLKELLNEWRRFLSLDSFCGNKMEITREGLLGFEKELFQTYSPTEITKEHGYDIDKVLKEYLFQQTNETIIYQDNALLVNRLLYNCHLITDCYYPIHDANYENHVNNVLNQLNQCIVISQSDYFTEYFRHIMFNFNEEFASVKEASAHILHIIGVLNFKCHNYRKAIGFFKEAIIRFASEDDFWYNDEYFQPRLLLAYCYEYDHRFELAIEELVGLDISAIVEIYKSSGYKVFDMFDEADKNRTKMWSENFISVILRNKIIENGKNPLFIVADKRDIKKRKGNGDRHEILHSFAHCLNELGIKLKIEDNRTKDNVIHLLALSRAIMLYVAEYDPDCMDFQTCMYMIYGEAKDYDICLMRINQLVETYDASSHKNVNYEMENMFYLFLVLNQSNKTIYDNEQKKRADAAYTKFVDFAERRYDHDALIHIEIFRFRFEITNILCTSKTNEEIVSRLNELKKQSVGNNIFFSRPSTKLNQWIVQEYNKTIALYEFLLKYFAADESVNINELYNFASRVSFYRDIFSSGKTEQNKEKLETVSDVIKLIVDDFISPQSIFLLAPLTTAIPYQHQTENLSNLEDSLYSYKKELIDPNNKMYKFEDLDELGPDTDNVENIKWLFLNREYNVAFVAYKWNSESSSERYRFCVSANEAYERPILNTNRVNGLISNIKRANKRHSFCKNKQRYCCTTVIDESNLKTIICLCEELMIPFEKYNNKSFLYFFKGKSDKNHYQSWYIIAVNNKLCDLQVDEIVYKLCGHDDIPQIKLAISKKDFCYISYGISDTTIVKNDLVIMQEKHRVRFWYNKSLMENGYWNDLVFQSMNKANCIIFFISINRLKQETKELYKEVLNAYDNKLSSIIVPIGFSHKRDFLEKAKDYLSGKERSDDVFKLLYDESTIYDLREQCGFDFDKHLTENSVLISELKKLEVVRI